MAVPSVHLCTFKRVPALLMDHIVRISIYRRDR